ncbi:Heme oxygenase 1 [Asimina triloba]
MGSEIRKIESNLGCHKTNTACWRVVRGYHASASRRVWKTVALDGREDASKVPIQKLGELELGSTRSKKMEQNLLIAENFISTIDILSWPPQTDGCNKTEHSSRSSKATEIPFRKEADFTAESSLTGFGKPKFHLSMACSMPISQSHALPSETQFKNLKIRPFLASAAVKDPNLQARIISRRSSSLKFCSRNEKLLKTVVVSAITAEKPKKHYPGEAKGFVEEMRFVAMKLHTRDQAKEGEKEADTQPIAKWEPSIEGYLRFLVDSTGG